jgi:predicted nucleic acid-binding protein
VTPLVLPDTSVWSRRHQADVAEELANAIEAERVATVLPIVLELLRSARDVREAREQEEELRGLQELTVTARVAARAREIIVRLAESGHHRGPSSTDLIAAAAAELSGAELWHCDRHFELIGEVTGQPMRRVGE